MSLEKYHKKRKFSQTPEPKGDIKKHNGPLRFVIQKHQASHLHYDFRLEFNGVLKSWAIPKGPSLDPSNKRFAKLVEDHPMAYRNFEGIIPEGNYGAGEVIIWDEGTYAITGTNTRKNAEKMFQEQLKKGDLKLTLYGKKIKGDFALISIRHSPNDWLLIKKRDKFSTSNDITKKNKSVRSGKIIKLITGANKENFSNLDKIYWPKKGYTKGDLIDYYKKIAPYILPYLKDRPHSLNRHPDGIDGESFFQKDVSDLNLPKYAKSKTIRSKNEDKNIKYLLGQNKETLLFMANLGCIEINPWNSRIGTLGKPDYMIIDLDPEDISFDAVIKVAQEINKILKKVGIKSLPKTSGSRGLHIYIPLGAKYTYKQVRQFCEVLVLIISQQLPSLTSTERNPSKRQGRVYLDYLQNARGATLVAPYSVRPRHEATVATPLKWSEVKKGLNPKKFTIKTIFKRLKIVGDLFKPVLGRGVNLEKGLSKIKRQFNL